MKSLFHYCYDLNIFFLLKTRYFQTAFLPGQTQCNTSNNTLSNAQLLYNYTENNQAFIDQMVKGCQLGGYHSACHLVNSNVTDILSNFNNSYHNYLIHPETLCVPFAEFTNNLESLFITGGCYLFQENSTKKVRNICRLTKRAPPHGYPCLEKPH